MIKKILVPALIVFSICNAQDNDRKYSSNKEDEPFKPYQISDKGLRVIAATSTLNNFENVDMFEMSYLGLLSTIYDNKFFTSVGIMQEYGYSHWKDQNYSWHFIYAKFGVETGFFNRLYFDIFFGAYVTWLPIPLIGLRTRYIFSLAKFIKVEVGGSLNFSTENFKIHNLQAC